MIFNLKTRLCCAGFQQSATKIQIPELWSSRVQSYRANMQLLPTTWGSSIMKDWQFSALLYFFWHDYHSDTSADFIIFFSF